ncbi:hypothetical protein SAMN02745163_03806 [Clostridium cavendishii DSM 21758]|uniref:Uncharacterized protein n=1 Tax=Clostridium cavendishii DSM 21758 TaxID=1121302 RepID=A0A1M6SH29_9CLOT|nr:hypothetical protein [Clostridium cavendishii]SHK43887.1 hypothetical protein SAMN02745163_03806 [Clostridium cavendishii DSM 21758]
MKKCISIPTISILGLSLLITGCSTQKSIQVSKDVKAETKLQAEQTKQKTEAVFNKELKMFKNESLIAWKDDDNVIGYTVNYTDDSLSKTLKLYNINIKTEQTTEILADKGIKEVIGMENDETLIVADDVSIYSISLKDNTMKKIYTPLSKKEYESLVIMSKLNELLLKKGYLSWRKEELNNKQTYEAINYRTGKKHEIVRYGDFYEGEAFAISEPYLYICDKEKIRRVNLDDGTTSELKIYRAFIQSILEDGTLLVHSIHEQMHYGPVTFYNANFEKNKITEYVNDIKQYNFYNQKYDEKSKLIFINESTKPDKDNKSSSFVGTFMGIIDKDKFIIKNKIPVVDKTIQDSKLENILLNPKRDKMIATNETLIEDKNAKPKEIKRKNKPPIKIEKIMKPVYTRYLFDIK